MSIRHSHKAWANKLKIVYFGGGGGTDAVLRALSTVSQSTIAIINIADDGGDSGQVRQGLGWAPGDVRRAVLALAADPTDLMSRLFRVRFDKTFPDREGQSFGNALFAAASLAGMGINAQIEAASQLLRIRGKVLPSTCDSVQLVAELENGTTLFGETVIAASPGCVSHVRLNPEHAAPHAEARNAILNADSIVVGPGSVVTSLLPAILPSLEAIAATRAARFLIMPAWVENPADPLFASDYIRLIERHFGQRLFDCVVCHRANVYDSGGEFDARPVAIDLEAIRAMGYTAVCEDLLGPDGRHSGESVAAVITGLTSGLSRQLPVARQRRQDRIIHIPAT